MVADVGTGLNTGAFGTVDEGRRSLVGVVAKAAREECQPETSKLTLTARELWAKKALAEGTVDPALSEMALADTRDLAGMIAGMPAHTIHDVGRKLAIFTQEYLSSGVDDMADRAQLRLLAAALGDCLALGGAEIALPEGALRGIRNDDQVTAQEWIERRR